MGINTENHNWKRRETFEHLVLDEVFPPIPSRHCSGNPEEEEPCRFQEAEGMKNTKDTGLLNRAGPAHMWQHVQCLNGSAPEGVPEFRGEEVTNPHP